MSDVNAAREEHRFWLEAAGQPAPDRRLAHARLAPDRLAHDRLTHARLECKGCPVAAGEVPDASCAECVVSVFLAAEPWPDDA